MCPVGYLTPEVVVGAVHHVGGVDELISGACCDQLDLCVSQNQLPSEEKQTGGQVLTEAALISCMNTSTPICAENYIFRDSPKLQTWCQCPKERSPSCVWSGRWASWSGSPWLTEAAQVWRWRTEPAEEKPPSHQPRCLPAGGGTSDARWSLEPEGEETQLHLNMWTHKDLFITVFSSTHIWLLSSLWMWTITEPNEYEKVC